VFLKIATFYWHWIGVTLALGQASSSSSCRSATAARGGGSTGRAAAADCTPGPTAANQLHLYGTRNRRLVWTLNRFAVFFFDIVWAGLSVTAYTSCCFVVTLSRQFSLVAFNILRSVSCSGWRPRRWTQKSAIQRSTSRTEHWRLKTMSSPPDCSLPRVYQWHRSRGSRGQLFTLNFWLSESCQKIFLLSENFSSKVQNLFVTEKPNFGEISGQN